MTHEVAPRVHEALFVLVTGMFATLAPAHAQTHGAKFKPADRVDFDTAVAIGRTT
jgi:hypothetical protein